VSERVRDVEHRVTPVELFFDLVFVFALTQVTALLAEDATWPGLGRAMLVLAVLWWLWVSFAWLTNMFDADDGLALAAMLFATGAMFVAALAVPEAFGRYALLFGVAVVLVRVTHLALSALAGRGDPALLAAVLRIAPIGMVGALLIFAAAFVPVAWRPAMWLLAVLIGLAAPLIGGMRGFRIRPAHFAERYGLVIIIALGESLVALSVGVTHVHVGSGVITAALLAMAVAGALWWAYFDVVAIVAERRFRALGPREQPRMARDSYTYLHLPMVTGIVLFALGIKLLLGHVDAELEAVPATALCVGPAMYFLALSTFKRRNIGSFNQPRLVTALVLVALTPAATAMPALVALACVAAVCCALIAYETVRYAEARDRIRHTTG